MTKNMILLDAKQHKTRLYPHSPSLLQRGKENKSKSAYKNVLNLGNKHA